MGSIIGWRTLKGMKKQHLAKYSYNGDVCIFCRESTPNNMSVSGRSYNDFDISLLIINEALPKCKICNKEKDRIDFIDKCRKGIQNDQD